ncbi:MAG: T9SS type A sorting domain-containing protein [Bacteroidota bacterium]|nr:T9SS type A sorting domain-containing protein [Bacteroidota bacterium]
MRKNYILAIVFLIVSTNLFGQEFGAVGTEWYYSEHAGGACPGNCEYLHLQSISDTVIDGITVNKITQTYYKHNGDTALLNPIYIYEQSDTVFLYNFSNSKFQTLYIFNGNQGDTLKLDSPPDDMEWTEPTYRLVIDTVITVEVDGIQLKKYGITPLDDYQFWNGNYFMDRVGGLDWFFPRAAIIPEAGGPIRCYIDSQIDTSFQTVDCDYRLISSIFELENKFGVKVYPIPTSGQIVIESEMLVKTIKLFDMSGRLKETTANLYVDISDFATGQYIMTITFVNGQSVNVKVAKNTR